MYRQAESVAIASLWFKIAGLWPFIPAISLHFSQIFSERTKLLKKKITYALIYLPAIFFSYFDVTAGLISGEPVKQYWGYASSIPENLGYFGLAAVSFSQLGY